MKYIITESRFNGIVDKIFLKKYGVDLKKSISPEGYILFLDDNGKNPFDLNLAGTLWVNDYAILNKIKKIFGLNDGQVLEIFQNYFKEKYDVDVVRINTGGYYEDDSWFDENI